MSTEDITPSSYKYAWDGDSQMTLPDFLTKFKPSMVQNDGDKPWIWVRGPKTIEPESGVDDAVTEAKQLLKDVSDRVDEIKSDDSIPMRSNKKTGAKSKKEVREQVQAEATEKLKDISIKHKYVSGKWLIFAPADKVDSIWSSIATSLTSGSLKSTSAYLAKAATSSDSENSSMQQHLICVYLTNVYDKDAVTAVMKILLREHGVNLTGVKSNLYTHIGLDSKHPSGIPSTVWKNTAILPDQDIKALKEAYFADLASGKISASTTAAASAQLPATEANANTQGDLKVKAKPAPKLKKKVKNDDPFASDDDGASLPTRTSTKPLLKTSAVAKKGDSKSDDDDKVNKPVRGHQVKRLATTDSAEERPKKKRATAAKKDT